ncbi:MAG: pyruvate kinase, partial [Candidatus Omnitrophica bacterium]|nr:pyruvate kinase [Candidatus Omnitrophota bacterium]
NKGINVPYAVYPSSALTEKDSEDLRAAARLNVDWIALSFVRSAEDLKHLRHELKKFKKKIPVMAKIEKAEALDHLADILKSCDGVMVARGDLGIEVGVEQVPILQKRIIRHANRKGVFVVTATEMLESMIEKPRPTRAEASDVANAILDGTDAVMLSGETAVGKHPLRTIQFMTRIIRATQRYQKVMKQNGLG